MLKKSFYIILIILGVLGIAATAAAAFVSIEIDVGTVLPGVAGLIIIVYAFIHIQYEGRIFYSKVLRTTIIVIVSILLLSFIIVETVIIVYENISEPNTRVNFVIVLGYGIYSDGSLTQTQKNRLDTAYDYLVSHEDTVCIVSGGQVSDEPYPEAQAMKAYLVSRGIDRSRIIEETQSKDTRDNMVFCSQIMQQNYPGKQKTAVIITNGYHIFRTMVLAGYSDLEAYAIAAPIPWYLTIYDYVREYMAIVYSVLFETQKNQLDLTASNMVYSQLILDTRCPYYGL